jgi:hypothetical protein
MLLVYFRTSGTPDVNFPSIYIADNNVIMQFYFELLYFHKRRFVVKYFTVIVYIRVYLQLLYRLNRYL